MSIHHSVRICDKLLEREQAIYLGRVNNGPSFATREDHLLIVGKTRSGKTSGLIIPSVAVHPGPVVVVSTRPDIILPVKESRREIAQEYGGSVVELGFGEPSGNLPVVNWSITNGCETWNTALDRSDVILRTAMSGGTNDFWREAGSDFLAGCLSGAALSGDDDREMSKWIKSTDVSRYLAILQHHFGESHQAAFVFNGIYNPEAMAPETRQSIFATISAQVLGAFKFDQAVTSEQFDIDAFVRSWGTVFIVIPWFRTETFRPLVTAFIEAVIAAWRKHKNSNGTLLLALDEVANVAPVPNLPKMITAGAGDGIQLILGMQDPAQANRWREEANIVTGGTSYTALYPGLDNASYLDNLANIIGKEVRYDFEVHVNETIGVGYRYADHARLIQERTRLEEARAKTGFKSRHLEIKRICVSIRNDRIRDGVTCRVDGGIGSLDDILAELEHSTTIKQVPKRLHRVEVGELHKGVSGSFYLHGTTFSGFRSFNPWFKDPFWSDVLKNS